MTGAKPVETTVYLQLKPSMSAWGTVFAARVVRASATKPRRPLGGTLLVKIKLRVPEVAYLPLQPEAVVDVPTQLTMNSPVEAEAVQP